MIPPIDDTYTIYFYSDNGGRTYFEGSNKTENWPGGVTTENFTTAMKAGKIYQIIAEFNDYGGLAGANLYWSYTGQSKTVITSSNLKYLQYVKNVPMTLQVNPFKIDVSPPVNEKSNSTISSSVNTNSSGFDTWFWIFLAILVSSATLNFIALFLQTYSSNGVFCFINQLQLILLLPMLPNFMNKDIQSFIASLNYSLLSFGFLDLNFNSIFAGISLDYSQPSAYLRQINLNSGSGIANAQLNIFGICLCIFVHVLVLI